MDPEPPSDWRRRPAPNGAVSALIRERVERLTLSQQRVAAFLLEQPTQAAVLSAADIARTLGTSQSTVVRLAQALDFAGFPELQRELRREVFDTLDTAHRLNRSTEQLPSEPAAVLDHILRLDETYLAETRRLVVAAAFESAVAILSAARRVFVVGFFHAAAPGQILALGLRMIGLDARVPGATSSDLADELVHLGPGDVVVGIGVGRYAAQTVAALADARAAGAATVTITDHPVSPLATRADATLVVRSDPPPFFRSLTAAVSVTHALVTAVALASPDRSRASLEEVERAWKRNHTFFESTRRSDLRDVSPATSVAQWRRR